MIARQHDSEMAELKAELQRLKQLVRELQDEREQNRNTIASLESERNDYRRALLAELKKQYSQEELERWANEEPDGVPLSDFIGELEHLVDEHSKRN